MKRFIITGFAAALLSTAALAEEVNVTVQGMVCAFCAQGIEHALKEQSAVEHVKVDLDKGIVAIHTKDQQTIDDKTIKGIIADAGFTVEKVERI